MRLIEVDDIDPECGAQPFNHHLLTKFDHLLPRV